MSEKFSLKWNDFQSNVSRTFSQLRSEEEFFDVSLVSDDQKMMSAHKLVLSASSPYFKHILTTNKHSHPLLCLEGVSSQNLNFVLDYIYQGEVQIFQEQLDEFLKIAQKYQLEGLTAQEEEEIKAEESVLEAMAGEEVVEKNERGDRSRSGSGRCGVAYGPCRPITCPWSETPRPCCSARRSNTSESPT